MGELGDALNQHVVLWILLSVVIELTQKKSRLILFQESNVIYLINMSCHDLGKMEENAALYDLLGSLLSWFFVQIRYFKDYWS